jgi:hypothetical protein
MEFKIYFSRGNNSEDYFTISGENIEEIRKSIKAWLNSRGLNMDNYLYSEQINK